MKPMSAKLATPPTIGTAGYPGQVYAGSYHGGSRRRMTTSATQISPYMTRWRNDAVLTAGDVGDRLDRILVPLRGGDNLERILGFVGVLLRESDAAVTLFNVAEEGQDASRGELLVRGACDRLTEEQDIDPERVDWVQQIGSSATEAIVAAAPDYDLLILGESDTTGYNFVEYFDTTGCRKSPRDYSRQYEPSLTDRILGNVTNEVIEKSPDPSLIVRNA
jgi:nucleotide-binding universal stress UspA family protein